MSHAAKLLAVPEEFIRRLADTPIANHRATEDLARIQIDAIRLLNECRYVGERTRSPEENYVLIIDEKLGPGWVRSLAENLAMKAEDEKLAARRISRGSEPT